MSPYVLVHGKGANQWFWRGFPPIPGTSTPNRDPVFDPPFFGPIIPRPCWQGLADNFAGAVIPFDESISLGAIVHPERGPENSQGSIDEQAQELGTKIPGVVRQFGTHHFHIIAHSKGGLDSRAWLTDVKPATAPDLILGQFITLNTPHQGSVVADYAVAGAQLDVFELLLAEFDAAAVHPHIALLLDAAFIGPLFGVTAGTPATFDLTTSSMETFNGLNIPRLVHYQNRDTTRPTFLATRSDADLNGNGSVTVSIVFEIPDGDELFNAICYDPATGVAADSAYQALRRVSRVVLDLVGGRRRINQTLLGEFELNDLLVPYSSAVPPGSPFALALTYAGPQGKDHGVIADADTGIDLRSGYIPRLK